MNVAVVAVLAFGIGVVSGLRCFTPVAIVSWLAVWGWMPVAGSPFWFLGAEPFAIGISILALVELIGDKLPKTPARIHLMPLLARIVAGGLSAGAFCFSAGRAWTVGLVPGGSGAILGAFAGYYGRGALVRGLRIPDFLVALVEDFVTIAGTLFLVNNFFHTRM